MLRRRVLWVAAGLSVSTLLYAGPTVVPKKPLAVPPLTPPKLNLPAMKDVELDNMSFEHGLDGWKAEGGDAFAKQPTYGNNVVTERVRTEMEYANNGIGGDYWKKQPYPIGIKGSYWIGTFEARPDARTAFATTQLDTPIGTLTSLPFVITKRYCEFLIGGGSDANTLRVELQVQDGKDVPFKAVAQKTSFRNSEELYRTEIDMQAYRGKTARLVIVDNSKSAWGHINVDDFRFVDRLEPGIPMIEGATRYRLDADAPVWGFADTHAHPAAHEAFGKHIVIGNMVGSAEDTYATKLCTESHSVANGTLNTPFIIGLDGHGMTGWPDLVDFPRFNVKTHQKYHVDMIKRAWQGGLRLMSAVAVHNMYIASRKLAAPHDDGVANDDESVMYRELGAVIAMARDNSSWMEIAREPSDARRIIRQGKLAIVLGVEADVFGNFKSSTAKWTDERGSRPLVEINDRNADTLLDAKLTEYYRYGIRQILPLHYLGQPFGATAAFNGNTFLPQMEIYDKIAVKNGQQRGVSLSLYDDFPTMAALLGSAILYPNYVDHIIKQGNDAELSTVNADGLTAIGEKLFAKLMERHFIVDVEHGSYESKDGIFRISAAHQNYPVIASHVDPLGLSYSWTGAPVRWPTTFSKTSGFYTSIVEERWKQFGTTNIRNLGHEMELSDSNYTGVRDRKGTVGVFLTLNRKHEYKGTAYPRVPDNCSGSTKTFAQMYLYSLDKMGGRGVALASDFPLVDTLAPRFGPYACWGNELEELDRLKHENRTFDRMAQINGVLYDRPSGSYNPRLFEGGDIDGQEEDLYKALAAWKAGAPESAITYSTDALHRGRILNFYRGLVATSSGALAKPTVPTDEGPAEQGAMFLLKSETNHVNNPLFGLTNDHIASINTMANKLRKAFNEWRLKDGRNEMLRRAKTGNRDWDYNLDGLAHYGLVPDMLQDLVNIGVRGETIWPLFASAEDYIEAWEIAKTIGTPVAPAAIRDDVVLPRH